MCAKNRGLPLLGHLQRAAALQGAVLGEMRQRNEDLSAVDDKHSAASLRSGASNGASDEHQVSRRDVDCPRRVAMQNAPQEDNTATVDGKAPLCGGRSCSLLCVDNRFDAAVDDGQERLLDAQGTAEPQVGDVNVRGSGRDGDQARLSCVAGADGCTWRAGQPHLSRGRGIAQVVWKVGERDLDAGYWSFERFCAAGSLVAHWGWD